VRSPNILPSVARQFSVRIDEMDPFSAAFDEIELPDDLHSAVPKRQVQFRAGRFCAINALEALDPQQRIRALPRGRNGAPCWPEGVTGSITHTHDFVSAAVARTCDALAIGIDSEPIMADAQARRVMTVVAWPSELAHARAGGFSRLEALTLVFSAKESLFKCLHPVVGRRFDYHDVRIVGVDAASGSFYARPVMNLSPRFSAGATLEGRFELDHRRVHTGMFLRADPQV
jgi:enterobactin synthetase component D